MNYLRYKAFGHYQNPRVTTVESLDTFYSKLCEAFPLEVDVWGRHHPPETLQSEQFSMECRQWLLDNIGWHTQEFGRDSLTFRQHAISVNLDAPWCQYKDGLFRFKHVSDAVLFRLTWSGR